MISTLSISAVLSLTTFVCCISANSPMVTTKKGIVQGFVKDVEGKSVSVFLGIPYAKPPVKHLRFKHPEEAESWKSSGILNATSHKPACPQKKNAVTETLGANFEITETSEDCLYLNIYVPERRSGLLPVLFYIHGGAFQMGSGNLRDGSVLAVHADAVVVTTNYRLGILGFLSTEDSVAPGNSGLLDQRLALRWVHDNINSFGGDKSLVTIFGQEAGAYSVALHVLSPLSRGLFARAISHGGPAASYGFLTRHPRMRLMHFSKMEHCRTRVHSEHFTSEDIVACLNDITVDELVEHDGHSGGQAMPSVDGHFLPDDPVVLLKSGSFKAVDYVIGVNRDEGTSVANNLHHHFFTAAPGITKSDFVNYVSLMPSLSLYATVATNAKTILTAVISAKYYPREETLAAFRRSYLDALSDVLVSKTFETGHLYSGHGKVFVFYFTHKPSASRFPDYVGSGDAEGLAFVFGDVLQYGTEEEKRLSRNWMKAWGRFARTGNPNFNNGDLSWPEHKMSSSRYLEIRPNMTSQNVKANWKPDVRRLWNTVLPEVAKLSAGTVAAMKTSVECNSINWGLPAEAADAVFIVLIIVSCFLLLITGGLTFILHKTNLRQIKFAERVQMSNRKQTAPEENGIEKTCHTQM